MGHEVQADRKSHVDHHGLCKLHVSVHAAPRSCTRSTAPTRARDSSSFNASRTDLEIEMAEEEARTLSNTNSLAVPERFYSAEIEKAGGIEMAEEEAKTLSNANSVAAPERF